jgi:hypothetical protein
MAIVVLAIVVLVFGILGVNAVTARKSKGSFLLSRR